METRTLLGSLCAELGLEIVAGGEGLDRRITGTTIQKPGLALAGFTAMLEPGRIQVLGHTEIDYLWSLGPEDRATSCETLAAFAPPAIVVTRGGDVPDELALSADLHRVPLIRTALRSSIFVEAIHRLLGDSLARVLSVHGVLVDVFGVGVLITGRSGIGKSECALDLVMRGHRLVADDVVDVRKRPPAAILGAGNDLIRHHMEIRGLGIINIRDLFGVSAIRETKRIDLVIHLEEWSKDKTYDRLGVVDETHDILGVPIPKVVIPLRPGRSLTSIVEVAARNQLLKVMGHHSALDFKARVDSIADSHSRPPQGVLPHSLVVDPQDEDLE